MAKKHFCESCGIPLQKESMHGTEIDGSYSEKYCSWCYMNGRYTFPDMTMEEMVKVGISGLDANPAMGKLSKFIMKKMYPTQVKMLPRWKK
jgi:hypothetical protein